MRKKEQKEDERIEQFMIDLNTGSNEGVNSASYNQKESKTKQQQIATKAPLQTQTTKIVRVS